MNYFPHVHITVYVEKVQWMINYSNILDASLGHVM